MLFKQIGHKSKLKNISKYIHDLPNGTPWCFKVYSIILSNYWWIWNIKGPSDPEQKYLTQCLYHNMGLSNQSERAEKMKVAKLGNSNIARHPYYRPLTSKSIRQASNFTCTSYTDCVGIRSDTPQPDFQLAVYQTKAP